MIFGGSVVKGASGFRWRDTERASLRRGHGAGEERSFEEDLALFERQVRGEIQHQTQRHTEPVSVESTRPGA